VSDDQGKPYKRFGGACLMRCGLIPSTQCSEVQYIISLDLRDKCPRWKVVLKSIVSKQPQSPLHDMVTGRCLELERKDEWSEYGDRLRC